MLFFKNKKHKKDEPKNVHTKYNNSFSNELVSKQYGELVNSENEISPISIEKLPVEYTLDYSTMHEIKDPSVISRIDGLFHGMNQQFMHTAQKNALKKSIDNLGEVFTSNISSAELANVKNSNNTYRGFIRRKNSIKKHAEFKTVDSKKIKNSNNVAAGAANVMNIASFVVGQYYMNEVNSKLIDINKGIKTIDNYQQIEFKSRIMALINNVEETSNYSVEILENQKLNKSELNQLSRYKNDAVQLLSQVNITIEELTNENIDNIQEYEIKVNDFEKLIGYQNILTLVLNEISKLIYSLNLGEVSAEKCYSSYNNLLNNSNESKKLILIWHNFNIEKLEIDIDNNRFKKKGFKGIASKPLTLIDKKWDYNELEIELKNKIIIQRKGKEIMKSEPIGLFSDDVQIIAKGGKYYYTPNTSLL